MAIRLPFDCSVLGVPAPERGENFKPTRKSVKDAQGKPTQDTQPYELFTVPREAVGSVGHPLKSFHPSPEQRKRFYVQESFRISIAGEHGCPAVAAMEGFVRREPLDINLIKSGLLTLCAFHALLSNRIGVVVKEGHRLSTFQRNNSI